MLVINTFETSSYQKLIKDITDKYEKNKNIDIVFKRNIENIELLIKIKLMKNTILNPFNKNVSIQIEIDELFPESIPIITMTSNVN